MPGELSPGSVGRRVLPEYGERKLREKIHRESKAADDHGKLPYSFSKPQKNKRHTFFECLECGHIINAPINTVVVICSNCKQVTKVEVIS